MPRTKRKRKAATKKFKSDQPLDQLRTGMPALDSIVGVTELRKGKKVYRLLQTKEVDEYEQVPQRAKKKRR